VPHHRFVRPGDQVSGIKRTAADKRFSLMIRERDNWTCQRCGAMKVPNSGPTLHCAHGFTRRCSLCTTGSRKPHYCVRLDPDAALALCYGCHQWVDSHADDKRDLWVSKLGVERYEALAARAHGRRDRV
jgi:hypothetical protein